MSVCVSVWRGMSVCVSVRSNQLAKQNFVYKKLIAPLSTTPSTKSLLQCSRHIGTHT